MCLNLDNAAAVLRGRRTMARSNARAVRPVGAADKEAFPTRTGDHDHGEP